MATIDYVFRIQESDWAYGPIIVEDVHTDELRGAKIIPHADRTFHIALSDVSFQDARPAGSPHVPLANIPVTSPLFIRDIEGVLGNENFGDVLLVNGKHGAPFNDAAGNFQQFWPKGQRTTAAPIQVNEDESRRTATISARMTACRPMARSGGGLPIATSLITPTVA
jgi:hypothetical protein